MIVAGFFGAGFALGWVRAGARGGVLADRVQFGLAHGIPAALLGVVIVIVLMRTGVA